MSNIELEDDIVLAKFINYMQKALYHRRLNYFRTFEIIRECEVSINEDEFKEISIIDITLADINNITSNNLEKFIIFLSNILNNDTKTRNRKLTSAKKFFEYLEVNNFISINPARNMTSGRVEKRIPKHLSLTESKQLLANTINSDSKFKIRNYAITCIFLNCSLRLSELTSINLSDLKLDASEQTLRVIKKELYILMQQFVRLFSLI